MRFYKKKFLALLLVLSLLIPNTIAFAEKAYILENKKLLELSEENEDIYEIFAEQPYVAIDNYADPDSVDFYYIPIRDAAESNGATVKWDAPSRGVHIQHKDSRYVFSGAEQKLYINGSPKNLRYPVKTIDSVAYAQYEDLAFLYEDSNETYNDLKSFIVPLTYEVLKQNKIPSLTLSFIDNDSGFVWEQGFGYADIENKKRVQNDSVYNIASISKTFTALSIMKLAEEGKIDINEKVTKYIPSFNQKTNPIYGGDYKNITVKMLLSHTSGISSDIYGGVYTTNAVDKSYTNNFVKNFNGDYMQHVENKRILYANAGYSLLGEIIAKTAHPDLPSADGYMKYVNENIISKIGMDDTSFLADGKTYNLASKYRTSENPKKAYNYPNFLAAGGISSSSSDMSMFMKMLLDGGSYNNNTIINKTNLDTMFSDKPVIDPLNTNLDYRLGIYRLNFLGDILYGHDGALGDMFSAYYLSKEQNLGCFIASNSASSAGVPSSFASYILSYAIELKTGTVNTDDGSSQLKLPDGSQLNSLKQYEGTYNSLGTIKFYENYFTSSYGNIANTYLGNNVFEIEGGLQIQFVTIDGVDCIVVAYAGGFVLAQKCLPEYASQNFISLTGEYYVVKNSPNEESIFTKVELAVDPNGYPMLAYMADNAEDGIGTSYLKEGNGTLTSYGIMRSFGFVLEPKVENGKTTIKIFGMKFVKK